VLCAFYRHHNSYMLDRHTDASVLHELPSAIRQQMSMLLNREVVSQIPVLRGLDLNSVVALMQVRW
jgi:hypothetical protein